MAWLESLRCKARTYGQFSAIERQVLWEAFWWLPVVALSLRLAGLHRTSRGLARRAERFLRWQRGSIPISASTPSTTARMVRMAARYYGNRITCLPQSLVLWFLLRRQGIESQLRIGTRLYEGRLEAHAWVECKGEILNDSLAAPGAYAAFPRDMTTTLKAS